MTAAGLVAVLDLAAQVAEAGIGHAKRSQLLREAKVLYARASEGRARRADLLLALEERLAMLDAAARQRLLVAVHAILKDQVSFDDECLAILEGRRR